MRHTRDVGYEAVEGIGRRAQVHGAWIVIVFVSYDSVGRDSLEIS